MNKVNNVWLMKTFKEWADRFMSANPQPYVALDEPNVDLDYGKLSEAERKALFNKLEKEASKKRRWNQIKKFFDRFYDDVSEGDILVLGTGQTTKFHIYAIVKLTSEAYFVNEGNHSNSRHRRNVEILWMGEPIQMEKWGWARRLECLDNEERLKEFISVYTHIKN